MVNVQNVSEFTCQVLNRDVWSHKRIKDLIKEHFLFLQVEIIIYFHLHGETCVD